jgi:hypothetical protein
MNTSKDTGRLSPNLTVIHNLMGIHKCGDFLNQLVKSQPILPSKILYDGVNNN